MFKKIALFTGLILVSGIAKAGWFDLGGTDQYTVNYTSAGVIASTNVCLISLSSSSWQHPSGARSIVIDSIQIDNDKAAATTSIVKIGVVREINASSGTIVWFERMGNGVNVSNTNAYRSVKFDPGLDCRVNSVNVPGGSNIGTTPFLLTNDTLQSTVLTTSVLSAIPSVVTTTPVYTIKVGDILMNVVNSATANLNVVLRYHTKSN